MIRSVIDNQEHRMSDVLNRLLGPQEHKKGRHYLGARG